MNKHKSITLSFHSVGSDDEVCYKGACIDYIEFLENKPNEIIVNYVVVDFPDKLIEIGGHTYKLVEKEMK